MMHLDSKDQTNKQVIADYFSDAAIDKLPAVSSNDTCLSISRNIDERPSSVISATDNCDCNNDVVSPKLDEGSKNSQEVITLISQKINVEANAIHTETCPLKENTFPCSDNIDQEAYAESAVANMKLGNESTSLIPSPTLESVFDTSDDAMDEKEQFKLEISSDSVVNEDEDKMSSSGASLNDSNDRCDFEDYSRAEGNTSENVGYTKESNCDAFSPEHGTATEEDCLQSSHGRDSAESTLEPHAYFSLKCKETSEECNIPQETAGASVDALSENHLRGTLLKSPVKTNAAGISGTVKEALISEVGANGNFDNIGKNTIVKQISENGCTIIKVSPNKEKKQTDKERHAGSSSVGLTRRPSSSMAEGNRNSCASTKLTESFGKKSYILAKIASPSKSKKKLRLTKSVDIVVKHSTASSTPQKMHNLQIVNENSTDKEVSLKYSKSIMKNKVGKAVEQNRNRNDCSKTGSKDCTLVSKDLQRKREDVFMMILVALRQIYIRRRPMLHNAFVQIEIIEQPIKFYAFDKKPVLCGIRKSSFPTIKLNNYNGSALVLMSCVTADSTYRPHPCKIVPSDQFNFQTIAKHGIAVLLLNKSTMTCSAAGVCLQQMTTESERNSSLALRSATYADYSLSVLRKSNKKQPLSSEALVCRDIRLCFQVFLPGLKNDFTISLPPVFSDVIKDSKDSLSSPSSDAAFAKLFDEEEHATTDFTGFKVEDIKENKVLVKNKFDELSEEKRVILEPKNLRRKITPKFPSDDFESDAMSIISSMISKSVHRSPSKLPDSEVLQSFKPGPRSRTKPTLYSSDTPGKETPEMASPGTSPSATIENSSALTLTEEQGRKGLVIKNMNSKYKSRLSKCVAAELHLNSPSKLETCTRTVNNVEKSDLDVSSMTVKLNDNTLVNANNIVLQKKVDSLDTLSALQSVDLKDDVMLIEPSNVSPAPQNSSTEKRKRHSSEISSDAKAFFRGTGNKQQNNATHIAVQIKVALDSESPSKFKTDSKSEVIQLTVKEDLSKLTNTAEKETIKRESKEASNGFEYRQLLQSLQSKGVHVETVLDAGSDCPMTKNDDKLQSKLEDLSRPKEYDRLSSSVSVDAKGCTRNSRCGTAITLTNPEEVCISDADDVLDEEKLSGVRIASVHKLTDSCKTNERSKRTNSAMSADSSALSGNSEFINEKELNISPKRSKRRSNITLLKRHIVTQTQRKMPRKTKNSSKKPTACENKSPNNKQEVTLNDSNCTVDELPCVGSEDDKMQNAEDNTPSKRLCLIKRRQNRLRSKARYKKMQEAMLRRWDEIRRHKKLGLPLPPHLRIKGCRKAEEESENSASFNKEERLRCKQKSRNSPLFFLNDYEKSEASCSPLSTPQKTNLNTVNEKTSTEAGKKVVGDPIPRKRIQEVSTNTEGRQCRPCPRSKKFGFDHCIDDEFIKEPSVSPAKSDISSSKNLSVILQKLEISNNDNVVRVEKPHSSRLRGRHLRKKRSLSYMLRDQDEFSIETVKNSVNTFDESVLHITREKTDLHVQQLILKLKVENIRKEQQELELLLCQLNQKEEFLSKKRKRTSAGLDNAIPTKRSRWDNVPGASSFDDRVDFWSTSACNSSEPGENVPRKTLKPIKTLERQQQMQEIKWRKVVMDRILLCSYLRAQPRRWRPIRKNLTLLLRYPHASGRKGFIKRQYRDRGLYAFQEMVDSCRFRMNMLNGAGNLYKFGKKLGDSFQVCSIDDSVQDSTVRQYQRTVTEIDSMTNENERCEATSRLLFANIDRVLRNVSNTNGKCDESIVIPPASSVSDLMTIESLSNSCEPGPVSSGESTDSNSKVNKEGNAFGENDQGQIFSTNVDNFPDNIDDFNDVAMTEDKSNQNHGNDGTLSDCVSPAYPSNCSPTPVATENMINNEEPHSAISRLRSTRIKIKGFNFYNETEDCQSSNECAENELESLADGFGVSETENSGRRSVDTTELREADDCAGSNSEATNTNKKRSSIIFHKKRLNRKILLRSSNTDTEPQNYTVPKFIPANIVERIKKEEVEEASKLLQNIKQEALTCRRFMKDEKKGSYGRLVATGLAFYHSSPLPANVYEDANGARTFHCTLCPYVTDIKYKFKYHFAKHDWRHLICTDCGHKANDEQSLMMHRRMHAENKAVMYCHDCQFTTLEPGEMEKHVELHIIAVDNRNTPAIITHSEDEFGKIVGCPFCNYRTYHKHNMKDHIRTHTRSDMYKCPECDYKTIKKFNLLKHLGMHDESLRLKCPYCSFTTPYEKYMKLHIVKHTGEGMLNCDVCSYTTHRKDLLTKHQMMHTGKNLFRCDLCKYVTAWKKNYNAHMLAHATRPSVSCQHCNFSTPNRYKMKRHLKIHGYNSNQALQMCLKAFADVARQQLTRMKSAHEIDDQFNFSYLANALVPETSEKDNDTGDITGICVSKSEVSAEEVQAARNEEKSGASTPDLEPVKRGGATQQQDAINSVEDLVELGDFSDFNDIADLNVDNITIDAVDEEMASLSLVLNMNSMK